MFGPIKEFAKYLIDQLYIGLANNNDNITAANFGNITRDLPGTINTQRRRATQATMYNALLGEYIISRTIPLQNDDETQNAEAPISLLSPSLAAFIDSRRKATVKNDALSQHYTPSDYLLKCPLLLDFPLIPVRFNGRLYDYDALTKFTISGTVITDPFTREEIQLAPNIIQPDYDAQTRMDNLYIELKKIERNDTSLGLFDKTNPNKRRHVNSNESTAPSKTQKL